MAFCKNCGTELVGEENFCSSCGAKINENVNNGSSVGEKFKNFNDTADTTYEYDPRDISDNKGLTVLSYISWLLLIPLFARRNSPFAQYHAKQGFTLALFSAAYSISAETTSFLLAFAMPTIFETFIDTVFALGSLVFVALAVIGIINVAKGRVKELPVIGKIKILK